MNGKIDWKKMVSLAEEIMSLAPWERFIEEDLFAVQPREHGPVYFASVMGSQETHHAIAYYAGLESLSQFRSAQMESLPERIGLENMLLNRHLQVGFEAKKHLIAPDLQILKSLRKSYRGKWPTFHSHRPARLPWIVDEAEARDLTVLMEQSLVVFKRMDEDLFRPFDADEFFLRTWDGRDSICRVEDLPVHRHIIQASLSKAALKGLRKTNTRLEADLILLLAPVDDVPPGEAPYLPMMLIVVDSDSGMILGAEALSTKDGLDSAIVRIPDALTGVLKKANIIPGTIAARHPILLSMLESYCDSYGIEQEEDQLLTSADTAIESIMEFMRE